MTSISGGGTFWARQTEDSEVFYDKPHVWFKIWFFLIGRVHHSDRNNLKRGQCFMRYEWIQEKTKASRNEVDHCFRWLKKSQMLATAKATHGMVITILNYDYYQNLDNYKGDSKSETKATEKRQRSDNIHKNDKNDKNDKNTPLTPQVGNGTFEVFWKNYPKKIGKGSAQKSWTKLKSPTESLQLIIDALEWQKKSDQWVRDNGQYIPHPSTYLNQRRWEDEPGEKGRSGSNGPRLRDYLDDKGNYIGGKD